MHLFNCNWCKTHLKAFENVLVNKKYQRDDFIQKIEKAGQKKTAGKLSQTEFLTNFTYRYFLQPNSSKHSRIFQINPEFKKIFQESPIRACCRNKNLKQIIGSSSTERKKNLNQARNIYGEYCPCYRI